MLKYLLILLVVIWLWFSPSVRRLFKGDARPAAGGGAKPSGKSARPGEPVDMVQCAHCGVHLPVHEAINRPGDRHHYCCLAHQSAGPANR